MAEPTASGEAPVGAPGGSPQADLVTELRAVARALTGDEAQAAAALERMADDVRRLLDEPLVVFPVIHHSPASAVHMLRYLRRRQPRLVFVELSRDLRAQVDGLRDCTLPVALQAFASEVKGLPADWSPLAVVAPLTELSAEYQAIAYALTTEGVELVFVDRDVDKVFAWADPASDPRRALADEDDDGEDGDDDTTRLHGDAVGLDVGAIAPSFAAFAEALLANARMSHFSEWLAMYVEEPTIEADTHTYREVLGMLGSLLRRLGSTPGAREELRRRDRFMWTNIKDELAARGVAPEDAVFICGAAHTVADDCPEWGTTNDRRWVDAEAHAPSGTAWKYGFVPSSYAAIEHQYTQPRGSVSLAEGVWRKAVARWGLAPYTLQPPKRRAEATTEVDAGSDVGSATGAKAAGAKAGGKAKGAAKKGARAAPAPEQLGLRAVLRAPPAPTPADAEELLGWCTRIVADARQHKYLASTADAIAIYETAILLARMRARLRPSPYDFIDAAETCLEKGRAPGRRDVRALCHRMLGGDRVGQIGYTALPPLVQDVYDRLAPLGVTADATRVVRVLMDFERQPERRAASRLLWRLAWLCPGTRVARPILGKLELGHEPRQESWDVKLSGAEQRAVIELAFAGATVEQVLERRLAERAQKDDAKTLDALAAAEDAQLLLDRSRLVEQLGERAVTLLALERGPDDAPAIFTRARRLVYHYRAQPDGLPAWLSRFVATGYATYATQLPASFADRGTSPAQLGAMLAFVFTLEGLALAMGCARSQLVIAIDQAATQAADPEKVGLLWAAEWLVGRRDEVGVRAAFEAVLEHPLGRAAYPRYLAGFLRALTFAPRAGTLVVELLGRAFARLPDGVLLPWLPSLLTTLREDAADVAPVLLQELRRCLPRRGQLAAWRAPGADATHDEATVEAAAELAPRVRSPEAAAARALLDLHRAPLDAWARVLGADAPWVAVAAAPRGEAAPGGPPARGGPSAPGGPSARGASAEVEATRALLAAHPSAAEAWGPVLGR